MNVAVHPVCAFVFTALRRYAKKARLKMDSGNGNNNTSS